MQRIPIFGVAAGVGGIAGEFAGGFGVSNPSVLLNTAFNPVVPDSLEIGATATSTLEQVQEAYHMVSGVAQLGLTMVGKQGGAASAVFGVMSAPWAVR